MLSLRSGRSGALSIFLLLASIPGCGPPQGASPPPSPSAEPAAPKEEPSAEAAASAAPSVSAAPEAGKPDAPAEPAASDAEGLARELLRSGGRRIGYSAKKKGFAYPFEQRRETGFSLDIHFLGEDGQPRDALRVCQLGECEEHLDEIIKTFLPKLASRLEADGYVSVRGIGWPQGRDDLEVQSLGLKLKYTKGRLEALREGKPPAGLAGLGKRLDMPELKAVFVAPGSKILGVAAAPNDSKGVVQELYVVKLP